MPKLFLRLSSIPTCELIGIDLSANSINSNTEVMIGHCCVSGLNGPKWFRQSIHSSGRIKYNFSSIQPKAHPMQRMMPTIANINSNISKLSFKYRMSTFSFHIIAWLIKISHSGNMPFLLFAKNISMVINNNCSVVESTLMLFSFKDRWDNHHIISLCQFSQKLCWLSVDRFWELYPRISFASTHKERSSPYLLKAYYICFLHCR